MDRLHRPSARRRRVGGVARSGSGLPAAATRGGGGLSGHERHLCRAADEPGLGRVGRGLDRRQRCRPMGGATANNRYRTRPTSKATWNPSVFR